MSGFSGTGGACAGVYGGQIDLDPASFVYTDTGAGVGVFSNAAAQIVHVDSTLAWAAQNDYSPAGPITGSCGPPVVGGVVTASSPSGRVFHYFPGYFTRGGDPTHIGYDGTFTTYPGVNDFTGVVAGSGGFPIKFTALGAVICGSGFNGTVGNGGVTTGVLNLFFPPNTTVSPGGVLDFNNLPTVSVISTTGGCGTSGYTFGITDGVLPAGMSLNPTTGALTGTPTVSGPYAFSVYAEKKSVSTYCWGKADYAGVVIIGSGGVVFAGTSFGPLYINAIPQWQIHRFDLRQRPENKS